MKKIIFVFAVVVSSFGMTNAQTAKTSSTSPVAATAAPAERTPEARGKELVAKINTACQLKDDQWSKVNEISVDFFTKQDALRGQKRTMDVTSFDKKMNELKSNRDKALSAVLTPEQNRKFEAAKAEEKANKASDKK